MKLVPFLLAVLGGLAQAAAFAPVSQWPLQILGIALLVAALAEAAPRRAALLGGLFGFAWLTATWWWVYISMHRFGGMPAPLAGLATALLGAGMALYYAGAAALWARWVRVGGLPALGFAACWLLAELARAVVFTGFPWGAGGYAHTEGPLAAWAPWVGVYGIGFIAAWLGAGLGRLWTERRQPHGAAMGLVAPVALAVVGLLLPQQFTRPAGSLAVTLLQPNVPQDVKFDAEHVERVLRWHVDALKRAGGTLVVTPESSLPLPASALDPALRRLLRAPFEQGDRAALVGVFTGSDAEGYTNSLVALSPASGFDGGAYVYGKRHLLPFGEFIPPGFGWFVRLMQIPIGDQAAGHQDAPLAVGGQRVRPLICYEDLFGEDFAASAVGPQAATVFANATNLAWFGRWAPAEGAWSPAQDQHLQFSVMRALEFQRPVVRATNTGATAAIDHRGHVLARLPAEQEGALDVKVEGRSGATPYARWLAALHLWPLAALGVAVLVLARRPRAIGSLQGART